MAGTVQRLIRHVWGFISNPATIENKQQSFNEGDDGAGRDRTQLVAKGPTGTLHTFITVDEIEDYVANSIATVSDVYVIVRNFEEFKTALSSDVTPYLSIYCDDGDGDGVYSSINDGEVIAVNGVKNIIGNGGTALKLLVNEADVNLTFNIDNELRFIDRIDLVGLSPIGSFTITNSGSGALKISEIKADDTGVVFTLSVTHATDPQKALIEINNSEYAIPNEGVNFDFDLWSGKHDVVRKVKTESTNIRTRKNTLIEHRGNQYGIDDQVLSYSEMKQANFSTGTSTHTITGNATFNSAGDNFDFYKILLSRYHTGSVFKGVFSVDLYDGSLVNVLNIYENGDFDFIKMNFDTATGKLTVDGDIQSDRIFGTDIHNNATLPTGTTDQAIASGTSTPTATLLGNVSAVTPRKETWTRVGNVVNVSGTVAVQVSTGNLASWLLSIPIPSTLSYAYDISGQGCNLGPENSPNDAFYVSYNAGKAIFVGYMNVAMTSMDVTYNYSYEIL